MADPEWFREFYDEALPVVYGYFLNRCGGRVDVAQDLTQETFVSAVRSMQQGEPIAAPLPWIVSIARRRLVDHYRRQSRERGPAAPDHSGGDPAVETTTAAEARVIAALDGVSPLHRAAIVLRYVDDLPVRELAGLLGKSERAIESLLVRARRSLLEAYGEVQID
jgi:RNA polymerase sigma-70 factor (ECF subfamily)